MVRRTRVPVTSGPFAACAALGIAALCVGASQTAHAFTSGATASMAMAPFFEPGADGESFMAHGGAYTLRLEEGGARLEMHRGTNEAAVVTMQVEGADPEVRPAGRQRLPSYSRYYGGPDSKRWRTNVPHYAAVELSGIYPGIDLLYYGQGADIEFDFHLRPGADPARIALSFGATDARIDLDTGDLLLTTDAGALRLLRPFAYQEEAGARHAVEVAFRLDDEGRAGFSLGDYDAARPLVIDPVIAYASALSRGADDDAVALAVDLAGNRYLAGSTLSSDAGLGVDVLLTKIDADGQLVFQVPFGSFGADRANAVAIGEDGRIYIAGDTSSSTLPNLSAALQPAHGGGQDGFLAILESDGSLVSMSYIGGTRLDTARAIALDPAGNIYIAGGTVSDDFPGVGETSLQSARARNQIVENQCALGGGGDNCFTGDGFIVKIAPAGASYVYASYIGGIGADTIEALAVDAAGRVHVAGTTGSADFPIPSSPLIGPFQGAFAGGGTDAFVSRLSADGRTLEYSSYLGGGALDGALALALDNTGAVYLAGFTSSAAQTTANGTIAGFPVSNGAAQGRNAGGVFDAFVTKLDVFDGGLALIWSTYLGSSDRDEAFAIAVNEQLQVFVAGTSSDNAPPSTRTGNLPLRRPLQYQGLGVSDAFVARFGADGALLFSTYLGGSGADGAAALALSDGLLHIAGTTDSTDFFSVGSFHGTGDGRPQAFLLSIDADAADEADLSISVTTSPIPVPQNEIARFEIGVENSSSDQVTGVMIFVSTANATLVTPLADGCQALGTTSAICRFPGVTASADLVEVGIRPRSIGSASLTASLLRADQSDGETVNNARTVNITVVDTSGGTGSLSWLLLLALGLYALMVSLVPGARRYA